MSYEQPPYGGFPVESEPRMPWWKSTAFIISVCVTLVAAMGIAIALVMINKSGSDDTKDAASSTPSDSSSGGGSASDQSAQTSSDAGQTSAEAPGANPTKEDPTAKPDPSVGDGKSSTTASATTTESPDETAMTVEEACAYAPEAVGTWISTDPAWGIDSGSEVLVATTLLDALGYGPGPSTTFTVAQEEATMQYQADIGVVADGVIGDDTWSSLVDQAC